jgi:hypothetical protein
VNGWWRTATLALVMASPALAETEFTIPLSYLDWQIDGTNRTQGMQIPLFWFGGPFKLGTMRTQAGGAWMWTPEGGSWPLATAEALVQLEWPLGPLSPYVGVAAWGGLPVSLMSPAPYSGLARGWMPRIGCKLDLEGGFIEAYGAQGQITGLQRSGETPPLTGSLWTVGLRMELGL